MALNRFQMRRDDVANFAADAYATEPGEPIYTEDERRIRVGQGGDAAVHQNVPPFPMREGIQFHNLWNCANWGAQNYMLVPATNGEAGATNSFALTGDAYAFTGNIPQRAVLDAAHAKIVAVGDFEQGSSQPAMCFRFELGNEANGTKTKFGPRWGEVQPGIRWANGDDITNLTGPFPFGSGTNDASIEVSHRATGPNSIHYPDKIRWELDATMVFMGYDGKSEFESSRENGVSDQDANVRVYGTLRWGEITPNAYGGFQYPGYAFGAQNYQNGNETVSLINFDQAIGGSSSGFPYGYRTSAHGHGYRAVGPFSTTPKTDFTSTIGSPTTSNLNDKLAALSDAFSEWGNWAPGTGNRWQNYWQRTDNEIRFCFEENVDLRDPEINLSLLVGGPHQDDLNVTHSAWASGTPYNPDGNAAYERVVVAVNEGGTDYAPRYNHVSSAVTEPGQIGAEEFGEWRRHWFPLSSTRRDIMRIHASTAYLVGGRAGVSDYSPV